MHQQLQLSHHIGQRNGRQDSEPGFVQLWNFCYTDGDTGHGLQLYELERRHHERCQPMTLTNDRQSQHHRQLCHQQLQLSHHIGQRNGRQDSEPGFVQFMELLLH